MPFSICQKYFPNNPELWHDSVDVTKEDFEAEFECQWMLDRDAFLKEEDQVLLMDETFYPEDSTRTYWFGLDCAGGSDITQDPKHDYTVLTIGCIEPGGIKRIIDSYQWQGDIVIQIDEILDIIHPQYGKYRCVGGLIDRGSLGTAIYDILHTCGAKVDAIMFGARDQRTGKNNKNAMFAHFLEELRAGRFRYPSKEFINQHPVLKKHIHEWEMLEIRRGVGINSFISAPDSTEHDDCCCSTVLFTYAVDGKNTKAGTQSFNNFLHPPQMLRGFTPYRL
jgi:hypothetical protein